MNSNFSSSINNNLKEFQIPENTITVDGDVYKRKERPIDNGQKALGFSLPGGIGECLDNGLDKGADTFKIFFQKSNYTEFTINQKATPITGERFKVFVGNNGSSFEDLNTAFNFGGSSGYNDFIFKDINEYKNKNGKFRYGLLSCVNIGSKVKIYTKSESGLWQVIILAIEESTGDTYISKVRFITKSESLMLEEVGFDLNIKSGSIICIDGIDMIHINKLYLEDAISDLINDLSITYSCKKGIKSILINNKEIKFTDPLGLDLNDDNYIKPTVFGEYEISLREILNKIDDDSTSKKIISPYLNIFNEVDIKNESIKIILCAINKNICTKGIKSKILSKKYPNLAPTYFPTYKRSGFYLNRNDKYIGKALGMLGIVDDHPDYTRFRGGIFFNPIFDDFFTIQSNKSMNALTSIIIDLIKEKIESDTNLKGSTIASKINNALKNTIVPNNTINESNITKKKDILREKLSKLQGDLIRYRQNTNDIDELLTQSSNIENECDLIKLQSSYSKLNSKYKKDYETKNCYIDNLINRIEKIRSRKVLITCDTKYQDIAPNLDEPLQECELAEKFGIVYSNFPNSFDFYPLDYNTDKKIDRLIAITSDTWNELNFDQRYGNLWNIVLDYLNDSSSEFIDDFEKFSFLEYKLKLEASIDHSLQFVSHIVCWKKSRVSEINALDGTYVFTDESKSMLVRYDNDLELPVKVIYLKDMIENLTDGKYKKNTSSIQSNL